MKKSNSEKQDQPTRRDFAKSGVVKAAYMAPVIVAAVKATESVAVGQPPPAPVISSDPN